MGVKFSGIKPYVTLEWPQRYRVSNDDTRERQKVENIYLFIYLFIKTYLYRVNTIQ